MNVDRWKQIEDCYHAALERPVPERAAFLAESCADDPGLRREVESLLTHEGQADELLESPAWNHITPPDETGTLAPEALSAGAMMAEYRVKDIVRQENGKLKKIKEIFGRRLENVITKYTHPISSSKMFQEYVFPTESPEKELGLKLPSKN